MDFPWRTVRDYASEFHRTSAEVFARKHPHPVLLHPDPNAEEPPGFSTDTLGSKQPDHRPGVPLNRSLFVIPIRRVLEDAFREHIRIGRARNNDVCLPYQRVSKLHAYFEWNPVEGLLEITDAGSRNGTYVDAGLLPPHQPALVRDSTILQLGDYKFRVQYCASFFELLLMLPPPGSGS